MFTRSLQAGYLGASDLSASRGGFALFENISFSVASGCALRVTGPNGTGKTTLLRCLAGLIRADSGIITAPDDNELHYLGHLNAMKPQLTVVENLNFWAKLNNGGIIAATLEAALETLNLKRLTNLPFSVLSSGQKRRVALARLMLVPRAVWLLDEPTVGLDTASQSIVDAMFANHLAEGGIIIAATHTPLGGSNWQTLQLGQVQAR